MRKTARFLLALAVALVLMLCFRALVLTIYTVEGQGLSPLLAEGDRVLVNRWSYGLRVGSPLGYSRIMPKPVRRGDVVAFENPRNTSQVLFCRCKAVPGDTIGHNGETLIVPGRNTCAKDDYYWMEAIGPGNTLDSRTLGFISERFVIGRAIRVVYSRDPAQPLWQGWRGTRFLLPI